MKALIFGVTGQDGHYLRELLTREGIAVVGVARSGGDERADVSDQAAVSHLIEKTRPDFVFHLAAVSSTSHEYLWENHAAISTGTLAILSAVEQWVPKARVLLVGSGLQFRNEGAPLHEESPLDHSSPYVIARNHSLFAARYFRSRGIAVYFAWLFNHDSPLRGNRHLNMRIAEAAVRAADGRLDKLLIGDLNAEKEFCFAGDITAAMWTFLQQDSIFECVVGSGVTYPVHEWLDKCFGLMGLDWKQFAMADPAYKSPYSRLASNPEKLLGMGWKPKYSLSKLAEMMVDTARQRVTGRGT